MGKKADFETFAEIVAPIWDGIEYLCSSSRINPNKTKVGYDAEGRISLTLKVKAFKYPYVQVILPPERWQYLFSQGFSADELLDGILENARPKYEIYGNPSRRICKTDKTGFPQAMISGRFEQANSKEKKMIRVNSKGIFCDCGNFSYSDEPDNFDAILSITEKGLEGNWKCLECGATSTIKSLPGKGENVGNGMIIVTC